ncbi:putative fatty acyl-CoA reductase CG5065 [Epargyreus clarus]|uniref:putative fatty acyl-CoA reductase CG5065 n=1 Tax=Epargyreus clarus TaxID=520877 RepID=UPI003C2B4121
MVARPRSPVGALIPQFYAGRSIFITGGTGFMGKVLIERLLSTCPDIGRLHLLLRQKKGVSPEKRLQQIKQSQVFDVIRQMNPSQLDKLCIVPGDTSQPGLGIAAESMQQLQEVSIVFHSAATLKFDEALQTAVQQNVLSIIRLMEVCDKLPNMDALIHVSTAYSNPERKIVEEKVYPPPASLPRLLALVDALPQPMLANITPQYIYPKPNTYTFTKAMSEEAVRSHGNNGYPIAIFRPTIVVSSLKHPFPGWIENLNGPSGVVAAAGKGLLHVFSRKCDARADLLPVDIAIDTLLAIAWETAIDKPEEVRVYNCSTFDKPTTWLEFENQIRDKLRMHPLDRAFWYPAGAGVENRHASKLMIFLLQTVPLHMAEYVLRALGIKMSISLITAEQKMRAMSEVLTFFALNEWHFSTNNVAKLRARLSPQDVAIYNLDPKSIDWDDHYTNFVKGTRKYLLKEKDEDIPEAKRHLNRLYYVHNGVLLLSLVLFTRLLLSNSSVREFVSDILRLLFSLLNVIYSYVLAPASIT